jgi:nucleoid-associated protein YgaU
MAEAKVTVKAAPVANSPEAAFDLAKAELEAARKKLVEMQVAAQTAPGPEKPKAYQAVEEAKKKVSEAEAKLKALEPAELIAEHTLATDETLSHLALKYYGHATPPYWQLIYEANKELIGDNPNRVRAGMVIKVPALPKDFKA